MPELRRRSRLASTLVRSFALAVAFAAAACASSPEIKNEDLSEAQLLEDARTSLARGEVELAVERAEDLLERTKDARLKPEALYLAGEGRFAEESYVKAFRHYETLLHDFPASPFVPKCEAHVYAIGDFYLSKEPWPVFRDLFSGRERGAEVMREFAASFPSSDKADDALARIASYRFDRQEYEDAVVFYARLCRSYPDSEWADLAAYRRAECWKLASRGAGYDDLAMRKAARDFRRYLAERPRGERRTLAQEGQHEVDEWIAQSELLKARFYVTRDKPQGARVHFANVALACPESQAAVEARRELEAHGWDLSMNSVDTIALPPAGKDE